MIPDFLPWRPYLFCSVIVLCLAIGLPQDASSFLDLTIELSGFGKEERANLVTLITPSECRGESDDTIR